MSTPLVTGVEARVAGLGVRGDQQLRTYGGSRTAGVIEPRQSVSVHLLAEHRPPPFEASTVMNYVRIVCRSRGGLVIDDLRVDGTEGVDASSSAADIDFPLGSFVVRSSRRQGNRFTPDPGVQTDDFGLAPSLDQGVLPSRSEVSFGVFWQFPFGAFNFDGANYTLPILFQIQPEVAWYVLPGEELYLFHNEQTVLNQAKADVFLTFRELVGGLA